MLEDREPGWGVELEIPEAPDRVCKKSRNSCSPAVLRLPSGAVEIELPVPTEVVAVFWLDAELVTLTFATCPVTTSVGPTNRSSATSIKTGSLLTVMTGPPAEIVVPSRITLLRSTMNSSVPMLMVWAAGADVISALLIEANTRARIEKSDAR